MHRFLQNSCKSVQKIPQNRFFSLATAKESSPRDVVQGPTTMMGSEAFVETLVSQGVTDVFGIVGSAFMDALDLFPDAGIRFISTSHEQNSVHMADGYSRISNRHGVCIAQNGPGITNFLTGLGAAYWAHSPVVAITPECGTNTKGLGGFQEIDQTNLFEKVTKYQANITNPNRITDMTSNAFDIAMYERGPTQINIPRDLFYSELSNVTIPKPKNIIPPTGNVESCGKALELIGSAKKPVILVGAGVRISGEKCIKLIKDFSENLGIPVATTYLHNDSFPASHEYYVGPLGYQGNMSAMKCISESDLIIGIGTRMNPFGTLPQYGFDYWPKDAKIIQIDMDSRKLGLTKPADVYIHGDCYHTMHVLNNTIKQMTVNLQIDCLNTKQERRNIMHQYKNEWKDTLNKWTNDVNNNIVNTKIKPRQALNELKKAMPDKAMISTDIGNICSVANSYLEFDYEKEASFLGAMTFGNCQYALGAAMGAKVANPSRFAVSYAGDGAWGMSFNEILTCNRENIPITSIVFNNNQWGAEKKNQILWFGDRYIGVNLRNECSFANIGKAMNVEGIQCNNVDEIGDALLTAHDNQMNKNKTTIIEIMCTKELGDPFRRDAMKLPKRHLDKYKGTIQTKESQTGQPTD